MLNFCAQGFRIDPDLLISFQEKYKHKKTPIFLLEFFVGDEGFEPPTPSV